MFGWCRDLHNLSTARNSFRMSSLFNLPNGCNIFLANTYPKSIPNNEGTYFSSASVLHLESIRKGEKGVYLVDFSCRTTVNQSNMNHSRVIPCGPWIVIFLNLSSYPSDFIRFRPKIRRHEIWRHCWRRGSKAMGATLRRSEALPAKLCAKRQQHVSMHSLWTLISNSSTATHNLTNVLKPVPENFMFDSTSD